MKKMIFQWEHHILSMRGCYAIRPEKNCFISMTISVDTLCGFAPLRYTACTSHSFLYLYSNKCNQDRLGADPGWGGGGSSWVSRTPALLKGPRYFVRSEKRCALSQNAFCFSTYNRNPNPTLFPKSWIRPANTVSFAIRE